MMNINDTNSNSLSFSEITREFPSISRYVARLAMKRDLFGNDNVPSSRFARLSIEEKSIGLNSCA